MRERVIQHRADLLRGVRDVLPLVPAAIAFGLVTGGAITQIGFGVLESVGLSVGVYSGAAQLAVTRLFGGGAPLLVTIATGVVISGRFVMYSTSLGPMLRPRNTREALIFGYLMRDVSFALATTRSQGMSPQALRAYYFGAALTDWLMWLAATTAGALGAAFVPKSVPLGFIVPMAFLALLSGSLESRTDAETAVVAACASSVLVPALPLNTGVLAAIAVGLMWSVWRNGASGRSAHEGEEGNADG
ncbi:MAG: hypothetical protein Kow0056_09550 [Coriobacteriia bacterium]